MINNEDLRLRNIKDEDVVFYNHKVFIVTWQKAKDVEEVARKLRMSVRQATQKAANIRARGVLLKRFRAVEFFPSKFIPELRKLAKEAFRPSDEKFVYPEEFIRIWQRASSIKEVAEHFKSTVSCMSAKAGKFRWIYGIKLKSFRAPLMKDSGFTTKKRKEN